MNDLPTPMSRIELYLATAAGMEGVTLPEEPESRLEDFLAYIAGDTSITLPTPMSLTELWLNYVAGGALTDEMKLEGAFHIGAQKVDVRFFAVAGGMDGVTAPAPQNRTEEYWARIAEIRPIHGVLKYATGTSITLTDVVRGITSLENVYGDTAQQTYTGKNLAFNGYQNPVTSASVTFTSNADGTVSTSGTASQNVNFYISNYLTGEKHHIPEGTYTLSTGTASSDSTYFVFSDTSNPSIYWDSRSRLTQTVPAGGVDVVFRIVVRSGVNMNGVVFKIQLESGSTATAFEPYVGGIPSPNPDFPQDMQVVTGEQTINIHGKNIFNGGTWRQIRTDGGIPAPVGAESIIVDSGTNFVEFSVPTTYRGAESDYIPVTVGQTITLSFNAVKICNRMWISQYDSSKNRLSTLNPDSKTVATTTVTTTNDGYIRVAFGNTSGGENFEIDNIQLELGSTATSYEPYQSQSYEVNLGKNLFDKDTITTGHYIAQDGSIASSNSWCISDYIPVVGGAYYTYQGLTVAGVAPYSAYYDENKTFISSFKQAVGTQTITPPNGARYVRFSIAHDQNNQDTFQIEAGSTATSYAPYFTPIELCKIGTYQDYIYKSGSDWYIHKAINKRILNGTEYWEPNAANTFFTNSITDYATSGNVPYSKYFSGYTNVQGMTSVRDNTICFINQSGQTTPRFYIRYVGTFTDTSGLRTWLSTNTPSIYYALATATDTKITDSTLISQLNAVNSAILPKPVAYITVGSTSPNLPASIKISYYGEEE